MNNIWILQDIDEGLYRAFSTYEKAYTFSKLYYDTTEIKEVYKSEDKTYCEYCTIDSNGNIVYEFHIFEVALDNGEIF